MTDSKHNCVASKVSFKTCPRCGFSWELRESFLSDPTIELIGYQTNFRELAEGLFYFNHACKGTLTLYASDFIDLYKGPLFAERRLDSKECPAFCLYKNNLKPCPSKCECAYVRNVVQIIKHWPKPAPGRPEPDRQV